VIEGEPVDYRVRSHITDYHFSGKGFNEERVFGWEGGEGGRGGGGGARFF